MAFNVTRCQPLDATRIELAGRVDREQLLEGVRSARSRSDHDYRTLLVITAGTELELSSADLRTLAHAILDERPLDAPHGRTAIVAPSVLAFGLARMTQVFMEQNPTDVQVFDDEDAAVAWMTASPTPT